MRVQDATDAPRDIIIFDGSADVYDAAKYDSGDMTNIGEVSASGKVTFFEPVSARKHGPTTTS